MNVYIEDDFSLEKIANSGQCFTALNVSDQMYRFIFRDNILFIKETEEHWYEVSCSAEDWDSIWREYFDLNTNYAAIRKQIHKDDLFLQKAADFGRGIRILRQDAWEMLLTFIISQRKSIPAIRKAVNILSQTYGSEIVAAGEHFFAFPTVSQLERVSEEALRQCGLGYRAPYIRDAISKVAEGDLKLEELYFLSDEDVLLELSKVKGIGIKVANCVSLFAYHRIALAPVDVWIKRIIDREYSGINPFFAYPDCAGIMQQYMFYYAQAFKQPKSKE